MGADVKLENALEELRDKLEADHEREMSEKERSRSFCSKTEVEIFDRRINWCFKHRFEKESTAKEVWLDKKFTFLE